ncbi:MAG: Holliday junction branch migration protein RuvA [Clostridia bacterium]|nr:Holliday junction branch migration protein RuvA [Clostridia bacterium]
MFYYIEGNVVFAEPSAAVIDVGGVAYKMTVSYNTFALLAGADRARLYTHLSVSENGVELYGFRDTDELEVYRLLTGISGVGPKAALSVLSIMTPAQLQRAVASDDSRAIAKAQGIGGKTAQLIILKLKDKLDAYRASEAAVSVNANGAVAADAIDALVSLGYLKNDVTKIIGSMKIADMSVEDVIREALRRMS